LKALCVHDDFEVLIQEC